MNTKVIVFFALVAVAFCAPAEEESAKQKRGVLAYPGALANPWGWNGWNGAYPYSGAWNGAYPNAGAWNGAFPHSGAWNGAFPQSRAWNGALLNGAWNGLNNGYPYTAARVGAPWAPAVAAGAVVV